MSGSGGQAGTVDLRTHLLGSGRGQAGQLAKPLVGQPHEPLDFPHWLQPPEEAGAAVAGGGQPHGLGFLQRPQSPLLENPSTFEAYTAFEA